MTRGFMNCEDARTRLPDYWSHTLEDALELEMEAHFAGCESCRKEAETLAELWSGLALIPAETPSPALRSRFYETLAAYKQGLSAQQKGSAFTEWLARWWPAKPAVQFAMAAALMVIGIGLGYSIRSTPAPEPPAANDMARLREEVSNMRQMVALSLLQQQSATERLRGVTYSYRVEPSDPEVLSALLHAVNHDANVNVRLAAVDALRNFASSPVARNGMVKAISKQQEPLVLIALMDQMVELKERSAKPALETISNDANALPEVRQRAGWAVEKLR